MDYGVTVGLRGYGGVTVTLYFTPKLTTKPFSYTPAICHPPDSLLLIVVPALLRKRPPAPLRSVTPLAAPALVSVRP